ncbi:MAG: DUF523 and DUF1722 domain-containing protein [Desulfobulbaceae bacterium]|nr:DUF523 and DUF1722 domain-containing protein [Desulfobulbaceae bacterium]
MNKPLIGISTCLLGENVRYDGGHRLDRFLKDILGQYVDYVPVCPEVECGLGIPREAVRLMETDGRIRLVTQKTGIDMTERMEKWMAGRLQELGRMHLCGFIFKAGSPSSGLKRIKVYTGKGVRHDGTGIFAGGFTRMFPHIPVEEDGRLHDATLRENFIERIFVMQRWHALIADEKSLGRLMNFHEHHKYLLMAHCPKTLKTLGALIAAGKKQSMTDLYGTYLDQFLTAIQKIATPRKNTNVLQHIMGYFKKDLAPDEKAELLENIERYHAGYMPLIVPVTLLNHYVRKYRPRYLQDQVYLNPHPMELMLRNHV